MTAEGQLVTPDKECWGNDESMCSELIHLYCLSPLIEAGKLYHKEEYSEKAQLILNYYKENYLDKILNFSLLSHFYSYVIEALVDLGEEDLARSAMKQMETYQKKSGAISAYYNVDWTCSTGMFRWQSSGINWVILNMEKRLFSMPVDYKMRPGDGMEVIYRKIMKRR